jgi:hypothetical protein
MGDPTSKTSQPFLRSNSHIACRTMSSSSMTSTRGCGGTELNNTGSGSASKWLN